MVFVGNVSLIDRMARGIVTIETDAAGPSTAWVRAVGGNGSEKRFQVPVLVIRLPGAEF